MEFLTSLVQWFADPQHWSGSYGIPNRVLQHLAYSGSATIVAALIALPIGLVLGHTGRFGNLAINIANVGRAIPTFGLIVMAFLLMRFSVIPVFIA